MTPEELKAFSPLMENGQIHVLKILVRSIGGYSSDLCHRIQTLPHPTQKRLSKEKSRDASVHRKRIKLGDWTLLERG